MRLTSLSLKFAMQRPMNLKPYNKCAKTEKTLFEQMNGTSRRRYITAWRQAES